jgi:predicted membrane-bound dolichyl-phosphate-mannose-protein mannosyltransferase
MGIKIASRVSEFSARRPWLPLALLAVLCLASSAARSAWIGLPCRGSCRTPADHLLIFDEHYYVNAARVIAGIRPPAVPGAAYRHAPFGSDPNAEHPQLAKLIMAGSIELVGNQPWGWRLGSIVFGTLAILGMFALVRWAGGSRWLALGAATLMAFDSLMIVQGRIGTLDVYVVTAMVWSVALYLRGQPLWAGLVAGIGACMKLFALDVVLVLVIYELLRWRAPPVKVRIRSIAAAVVATAGSLLGLLAVLDQIAPPYDNSAGRFVGDNPFSHLGHMISYAARQAGPLSGFSSYPWQWLVDYRPIVYLNINPAHPLAGEPGAHPAVHFLGLISPPILLAGVLGTSAALWLVWLRPVVRRWRGRGNGGQAISAPTLVEPERNLLTISVAWFLGTFGPFLIASVAFNRTTYLFYMMIVMPGLYLAGAWLVSRLRGHVWLVSAWAVCVAAAAVVLYPFTPLP